VGVDQEQFDAFLGKAIGDLGAAMSAILVSFGDQLGYYRALARGPLTPGQLASRTGTSARYASEWLGNQAAGGYVDYDAATARYSLNDAQAACLADPNGPVDLPGAYAVMRDLYHVHDQALENFRTGGGMEWGAHHPCLFEGAERFYRARYRAHLLKSWLPAVDGLVDRLQSGGTVIDLGCGHAASMLVMARAFPQSQFIGIDYHAESIDVARQRAAEAGVSNAHFEVSDAASYDHMDLDLVTFFDSLHCMGDPEGVARRARRALKPDGYCMIVEPMAGDRPEDNINPVARVYYALSALIAVPVSLARRGPALGTQAGEKRLRKLMLEGGFARFRRVAETPFSMVLEART
jgi:ubiquinone/menaquinone biosynthesis C-methylase UbiE